jgi:hypothetical protein
MILSYRIHRHSYCLNSFIALVLFCRVEIVFAVNLGEKNNLEISQRSRIATVENDIDRGKAGSILLRFTLDSAWTENFGTLLEVDGVKSFFNDDHSDGVNLNGKPLIPDVGGAEVNQALVSFNNGNLKINLGRQRINFDNQRFISGSGFWQNEQTFDALLSQIKISSNSSITYAYLANVNRIFGDRAGEYIVIPGSNFAPPEVRERPIAVLGNYKLNSHLGRLEWNEWDYSRWVVYYYAIDNKDEDVAILSTNTAGMSYEFNAKPNQLKYHLHLEAATQDRTEIIDSARLPYYAADASVNINAYEVGLGYELLSAKNKVAFITPLGALHEFQGWADQFIPAPITGVKDASINFVWRAAPFKIDTRYHTFLSYVDGSKIGNEINIDFIYKPAKKHTLNLRLANFISATQSDEKNIQKIYLSYSYNM